MYLRTLILVLILDMFFIQAASGHFKNQILRVQGAPMQMDMVATAAAYMLLSLGVWHFVVKPRPRVSVKDAFLLGLFVYGVYELTNKALLKNWTWETVALDTLWGGVLFATVRHWS